MYTPPISTWNRHLSIQRTSLVALLWPKALPVRHLPIDSGDVCAEILFAALHVLPVFALFALDVLIRGLRALPHAYFDFG